MHVQDQLDVLALHVRPVPKSVEDAWRTLRSNDWVIVPAHNEQRTIGKTLRYLFVHGVRPGQVYVVDSHCTDATIARARAVSGGVNIVNQEAALVADERGSILEAFGVSRRQLVGKGCAMLAGLLALARRGAADNDRVFFFDADIANIREVDPMGLLLYGWEQLPATVRILKLASLGRDNTGVTAYLNLLPMPFSELARFKWPLCGQQTLRFGDLKQMRFASRYGVEITILMQIVMTYGPEALGEVQLLRPLCDYMNDAGKDTCMFTAIFDVVKRIIGVGEILATISIEEVRQLNVHAQRLMWSPDGDGRGSIQHNMPLDVFLPSVAELT